MQSQDYKIEELQRLLLQKERDDINALKKELEALLYIIDNEKQLEKKVAPIISKHLNAYTKEMPSTLGPTITKTLKTEIENSKDSIIDVLYPIIGKLIKRYIQQEFLKLSEKINQQVSRRLSIKGITRKLKAFVIGVKEEDIIITSLSETKIQEIFVIEKFSGILKGSFSKSKTIDKESLSAMLTAIKAFAEDALKNGTDQLEVIEYGSDKIYIQNFGTYYVAVVLYGVLDTNYKEILERQLFSFSKKYYRDSSSNSEISKGLDKIFNT
ncbi:cell envelope biogenesis protein OmpA [uncultured Winogradskyella sp.]|uniref:cell envelope biogenesis protein OmpA n=1 Tax=uncultured Winogradskyella sp. TaxID=395353 RepID=UPI00261F0B8E|nr:cell envelope biogenesis protein OmpA [uncultured Winogradskyella sp.]